MKNSKLNSINKTTYALIVCLFLISLISCTEDSKKTSNDFPALIPFPKEMGRTKDKFMLTDKITIVSEGEGVEAEAEMLRKYLEEVGIKATTGTKKGNVLLKLGKVDADNNVDEAYLLDVTTKQVKIVANTRTGLFWGIQTLRQSISDSEDGKYLPWCSIRDWPEFKIRGFMHDNGRNFQSLPLLKEQLEVLALYKMNVFHWHFTDNPGWRLESKKYPQLQDSSATSRKPGKYYSHNDFREILDFCKQRHITVIPEFDLPGHTDAFRKTFGGITMTDEGVQEILIDLIDELCGLATPEEMPYIHLGTDEVRRAEEKVPADFLIPLLDKVKECGREVIVWREGIIVEEDSTSINQLWAKHEPQEGHRFIDSRSNYINHLDPFAGVARLFFQQPCYQPKGDSLALGGILCAWPDNRVDDERDILRQNPIYPSIVFYSDAIWNGRENINEEYWAKLPDVGSDEFKSFEKFETKVIAHRDRFFQDKEFPYVTQTGIKWKLIGAFDHKGDVNRQFPVEAQMQDSYSLDDTLFQWSGPYAGGTIHLKHFFGFPSVTDKNEGTYYAYTEIYSPEDRQQNFWIGFHGWSRAGGRRGGPFPEQGQWHTTNPKIWVNGKEIQPPIWKQPSLAANTPEIPFVDEDYFYREPTKVNLKKGWNKVLLKIPHGGTSWKWMFTCVPVDWDGTNVREVKDLKFDPKLENNL